MEERRKLARTPPEDFTDNLMLYLEKYAALDYNMTNGEKKLVKYIVLGCWIHEGFFGHWRRWPSSHRFVVDMKRRLGIAIAEIKNYIARDDADLTLPTNVPSYATMLSEMEECLNMVNVDLECVQTLTSLMEE